MAVVYLTPEMARLRAQIAELTRPAREWQAQVERVRRSLHPPGWVAVEVPDAVGAAPPPSASVSLPPVNRTRLRPRNKKPADVAIDNAIAAIVACDGDLGYGDMPEFIEKVETATGQKVSKRTIERRLQDLRLANLAGL
jgi:hypothetical protein